MTLYCFTVAPSVTLEQSGALIVAGQYSGVGRVPGHPLWHILARIFITASSFVSYRGQPNPAWATNFMSAFFGALSCGLVSLIISSVGRSISRRGHGLHAPVSAVSAGMLFAASMCMWSQSVITETYTLTLFFVLLFCAGSLVWFRSHDRPAAYFLAATAALGIGTSHMCVLLLPCLALTLLLAKPRICLAFCLFGLIPFVLIAALLFMRIPRTWLTRSLTVIILAGAGLWFFLPKWGRTGMGMVFIVMLGMALYLYIPLASEGNPPMNFGYGRTWEGFCHVITRGQYEKLAPTTVFSTRFVKQLGWYAELVSRQYFTPLWTLALIPFALIRRFSDVTAKWLVVSALMFLMFSVIIVIGANPRMDISDTAFQRYRLIPSFAILGIYVGLGMSACLGGIDTGTSGRKG